MKEANYFLSISSCDVPCQELSAGFRGLWKERAPTLLLTSHSTVPLNLLLQANWTTCFLHMQCSQSSWCFVPLVLLSVLLFISTQSSPILPVFGFILCPGAPQPSTWASYFSFFITPVITLTVTLPAPLQDSKLHKSKDHVCVCFILSTLKTWSAYNKPSEIFSGWMYCK